MKELIKDLSGLILFFAFMLMFGFSLYYAVRFDSDKAYQLGYDANKVGIRPEANPYIKDARFSSDWLRGWIDSEKLK